MAKPVAAGMPANVDIGTTFTLQIAALDATTGNAVANVNISNFVIEAEALGAGSLAFGAFMLVPGPGA